MEQESMSALAWKIRKIQLTLGRILGSRLEAHGLHFGLPRLMHLIQERPGASQKELAEIMMVTDAALSQSVKRLRTHGYVTSHEDPEDQRRKVLTLTDEGKEILELLDKDLLRTHREMFEGFDADDAAKLGELLDRIQDNLQKEG